MSFTGKLTVGVLLAVMTACATQVKTDTSVKNYSYISDADQSAVLSGQKAATVVGVWAPSVACERAVLDFRPVGEAGERTILKWEKAAEQPAAAAFIPGIYELASGTCFNDSEADGVSKLERIKFPGFAGRYQQIDMRGGDVKYLGDVWLSREMLQLDGFALSYTPTDPYRLASEGEYELMSYGVEFQEDDGEVPDQFKRTHPRLASRLTNEKLELVSADKEPVRSFTEWLIKRDEVKLGSWRNYTPPPETFQATNVSQTRGTAYRVPVMPPPPTRGQTKAQRN